MNTMEDITRDNDHNTSCAKKGNLFSVVIIILYSTGNSQVLKVNVKSDYKPGGPVKQRILP